MKTKKKSRTGRPKKEIDFDLFERICEILPTAEEAAILFDISVDTLERRLKEHYKTGFSELLNRFGGKAKVRLRRYLFRHSLTSPAVAIFLAKNLLGMSDQPKMDIDKIDGIIFITEDSKD